MTDDNTIKAALDVFDKFAEGLDFEAMACEASGERGASPTDVAIARRAFAAGFAKGATDRAVLVEALMAAKEWLPSNTATGAKIDAALSRKGE